MPVRCGRLIPKKFFQLKTNSAQIYDIHSRQEYAEHERLSKLN